MPGARGDKRSHLHPVKAKVGQKFAGGQTYPVAALVRVQPVRLPVVAR